MERVSGLEHKICRDKNKGVVKSFFKRAKRSLKELEVIGENGVLSEDVVRFMYLLTRMRELANEGELGFAAYFVTKDKRYFLVTNLKEMED